MTLEEFEALPKDSYCFEIPEAWGQVRDFYADALCAMAPNCDAQGDEGIRDSIIKSSP